MNITKFSIIAGIARSLALDFANGSNATEEGAELEMIFSNALSLGDDGFAMVAPYGCRPMTMKVEDEAAFRKQFPGVTIRDGQAKVIQEIDKACADDMANEFNSFVGRAKRFFKGANIYKGHPDVPGMEALYPDKSSKGLLTKLEAREDALMGLPIFNSEGGELLAGSAQLGFSGRWVGMPTGEVRDGMPVYRPTKFKSVGMVTKPNLPVEMLNSGGIAIDLSNSAPESLAAGDSVLIAEALAQVGIKVDGATGVGPLVSAITALKGRYVENAADLANAAEVATSAQREAQESARKLSETSALLAEANKSVTKLQGDLANAADVHRGAMLSLAITAGLITPAEKDVWAGRLSNDLINEQKALLALTPRFNTTSRAESQGSRQGVLDPGQEARSRLTTIASTIYDALPKEQRSQQGWIAAYTQAEQQNPALAQAANATA